MLFKRKKLIEKFQELLVTNEHQYILIHGVNRGIIIDFIESLKQEGVIDTNIPILHDIEKIEEQWMKIPNDPIIIQSDTHTFSEIRSFIESKMIDSRIIVCTEAEEEGENTTFFPLGEITFREYCESNGINIQIGSLFSQEIDIQSINLLRDQYLHTGSTEYNINHPDQLGELFKNKLTNIKSEMFEKEHEVFIDFLRTIAMGVGDLYKEERIAKLMNISRRKVRKYTELSLKHQLITAVGPFVRDTQVELSRHVKVYFSDLSYYSTILGVAYGHGFSKKGVLENFLFLELQKKLSQTHTIQFYKKKSGAEIPFVLQNNSTKKIIPIDLSLRPTQSLSQALKTFYDSYRGDIEYAMIFNDTTAKQIEWEGSKVLILPTIAV